MRSVTAPVDIRIFAIRDCGVGTHVVATRGCPTIAERAPVIVSKPVRGRVAVGCVLMSPSSVRFSLRLMR